MLMSASWVAAQAPQVPNSYGYAPTAGGAPIVYGTPPPAPAPFAAIPKARGFVRQPIALDIPELADAPCAANPATKPMAYWFRHPQDDPCHFMTVTKPPCASPLAPCQEGDGWLPGKKLLAWLRQACCCR